MNNVMTSRSKTLLRSLLLLAMCPALSLLRADGLSCESSPAVLAAQRELDHQLETATFEQSLKLREAAYQRMTKLDPTDYRPARDYFSNLRYDEPEKFNAARDAAARDSSQTSLQIVIDATLLGGKDTPRAFQLLEKLAQQDPTFAPTYIQQAGLYERAGKYADKDKAARALSKFYQICPSSLESRTMRYLKQFGSNELKKTVAQNLRTRLATSKDPDLLRSYSDIWSLEFSILPITEHPKERQQVAVDLSRFESLSLPATAEWLDFLKDGYKQSGATDAQVKAKEAQITREFPHSDQAFSIWYNDWKDQHPQPAPEASAAEWRQYMSLALAHFNEVPARFPTEHGFGYYALEYTPYLDTANSDEIIKAGEAYIAESDLYDGSSFYPRYAVASVLLEKNLQPSRALALLRDSLQIMNSPRQKAMEELNDYAKPKDIEDTAKNLANRRAAFNLLYLRACRATSDKSAAEAIKAEIETAPPADQKLLGEYWNARAVLAEIEGRPTDALAFYQKALFTREAPKPRYGKMNDILLADAKRLWASANGSEAAFTIWSTPDQPAETSLGRRTLGKTGQRVARLRVDGSSWQDLETYLT